MSFQPEKITKEHIIKAINDIEDGKIGIRPSTKYDVLYKGKTYPPKDIMRQAHKYATGIYEWIPGGGEPTNKYLKELGFLITNKEQLINVKEEFAGWLLKNAPESYSNFLGNSIENVIEKLNEIDAFFKEKSLFEINENNIQENITYVKSKIERNGRKNNPAFEIYDSKNGSGIPKAIIGKKNYLKFLQEKFNFQDSSNYWLFQGNPKYYDVIGALKNNALKTWKVAAHKDKIKQGDKIILWFSGEKSGCYALAAVTSKVGKIKMNPYEIPYYKTEYDENEDRVVIEIVKDFSKKPVLWEFIKNEPVFKDFKAGNQGTNFTATKAEYDFFKKHTTSTIKTKDTMSANNLNQILFGPPGTGKTFHTINEALKIVDPSYFEAYQNDRKKLTDRFKELLIKNNDENKGQIGFCTFHQSLSYEDFVEGIKPKTTDTKNVYYDIEPGVFKRICQLADSYNSTVKIKSEGKLSWSQEQFHKASFYKLSLGNYQDPADKPIYEYCRDHGYISIGFGQENDFSGLSESEIKQKCDDLQLEVTAAQQMNYFIHYLKKGNYVLVSSGNKYVRALGKVIGDYEFVAESPIRYNHFRKVEWIFVDALVPIEEIYERGLSQKTMYKIDETALKSDFFVNNGRETLTEIEEDIKNYVLIIDEINRGNVSSIFGELITLIEKDKRAGCEEELEVTLPYSKESFKVPSNVYLIGTMNTADRSVEALDTALRRRFSFKEMPPKSHLIKTEGASSKVNGMVENIDLEAILNTINARIEKLIDKDHRIGHSYFLKVDTKDKLVQTFKNQIIPLLEEYFFGDYGKIGLVLGASFVEKVDFTIDFAKFEPYDSDIQSDLKEKAVFRIKDEGQWDFRTI